VTINKDKYLLINKKFHLCLFALLRETAFSREVAKKRKEI
jgi:hypothetical protein